MANSLVRAEREDVYLHIFQSGGGAGQGVCNAPMLIGAVIAVIVGIVLSALRAGRSATLNQSADQTGGYIPGARIPSATITNIPPTAATTTTAAAVIPAADPTNIRQPNYTPYPYSIPLAPCSKLSALPVLFHLFTAPTPSLLCQMNVEQNRRK